MFYTVAQGIHLVCIPVLFLQKQNIMSQYVSYEVYKL